MDSPELLGAYLLYYWPVSYLEASLSLAFLGRRAKRVLDLGSGPGPAAAAFVDAAGATELVLADDSLPALGLAEELLAGEAEFSCLRIDFEGGEAPELGLFDAIVASHLLNELWKGREDRIGRRLDFVEAQVSRISPGGFFLAIEPATLAASRDLLALRDALAAKGWRILAPCPSSAPCPILAAGEGRSCHGEASWKPPEPVAALAARAGLDRSSVKWSFFVAEPPAPSPSPLPAWTAKASNGTDRENREDRVVAGRIVSEGLLNKAGRLRFALCSEGRLLGLSAKAASPLSARLGFPALGRYDRLRVEGAETRESGLGLVERSRLEIESAPGIDTPPGDAEAPRKDDK